MSFRGVAESPYLTSALLCAVFLVWRTNAPSGAERDSENAPRQHINGRASETIPETHHGEIAAAAFAEGGSEHSGDLLGSHDGDTVLLPRSFDAALGRLCMESQYSFMVGVETCKNLGVDIHYERIKRAFDDGVDEMLRQELAMAQIVKDGEGGEYFRIPPLDSEMVLDAINAQLKDVVSVRMSEILVRTMEQAYGRYGAGGYTIAFEKRADGRYSFVRHEEAPGGMNASLDEADPIIRARYSHLFEAYDRIKLRETAHQ